MGRLLASTWFGKSPSIAVHGARWYAAAGSLTRQDLFGMEDDAGPFELKGSNVAEAWFQIFVPFGPTPIGLYPGRDLDASVAFS